VEHVETYGYFTPCFAGSLIGKMGTHPRQHAAAACMRVRATCQGISGSFSSYATFAITMRVSRLSWSYGQHWSQPSRRSCTPPLRIIVWRVSTK